MAKADRHANATSKTNSAVDYKLYTNFATEINLVDDMGRMAYGFWVATGPAPTILELIPYPGGTAVQFTVPNEGTLLPVQASGIGTNTTATNVVALFADRRTAV